MQDWQVAKRKQDQHLDNIEKGLTTLKGIGEAMGEALKTQDVLIDTIDTKVCSPLPCMSSSLCVCVLRATSTVGERALRVQLGKGVCFDHGQLLT